MNGREQLVNGSPLRHENDVLPMPVLDRRNLKALATL